MMSRLLTTPVRTLLFRKNHVSAPPCLRRLYSDEPSNPTKQFYKTFTRPIAKVLLMAVLTYQLLYWSWVKLEQDEFKLETDSTIKSLEDKVEEYKTSKNQDKKGK